jgi:hypothetical protein
MQVREELEWLFNDDDHMADLFLTRKMLSAASPGMGLTTAPSFD